MTNDELSALYQGIKTDLQDIIKENALLPKWSGDFPTVLELAGEKFRTSPEGQLKPDKQYDITPIEQFTGTLKGQEAFVSPKILSSIASLSRYFPSLEGFLQVATGEKSGPLTSAEAAAGALRYEPLDQYVESIKALKAGINSVFSPENEVSQRIDKIQDKCEHIRSAVTGTDIETSRSLDVVFLDALAQAKIPKNVQSLASYDPQLEHAQSVVSDGKKLVQIVNGLPADVKNAYDILAANYASQCNLDSDVSTEQLKASLSLNNLQGAINGLDSGLQNEQGLGLRAKIIETRTMTRAIAAIFNTMNSDGSYDEIRELSSVITGKLWQTHLKAADIGRYDASPIPKLTGTGGSQPHRDGTKNKEQGPTP